MKRREFLRAAAALGLAPAIGRAQAPAPRFADMHSHLMLRQGISREALAAQGMLVVAEKVIPDGPLIRIMGNKLGVHRDAHPGEMRRNFVTQFERMRAQIEQQGIARVTSAATLDQVLKERVPAIAMSSEGADFLEGDLGFLEKMHASGLVCLQLVHYRVSDVGDISTEEPRHGGLTAFGRDVVRACNRLGILVDVAHCTTAGIEQALDISAKPMVYSHGHISQAAPSYTMNGAAARAIHGPLARRLADRGGVVGIWPLGSMYASRDAYADGLLRFAGALGIQHIGVGSDINGLPKTVLPTHAEFAELAGLLAKRGLKEAEVNGVMGGNYLRVLRAAVTV